MSYYNAREQSIPLATSGYVTGVRERIVQEVRLQDGTVVPGDLSIKDVDRISFRVIHSAVRMSMKSIGGITPRVRSEAVTMNVSQKTVRLAAANGKTALSLSCGCNN